MKSTKKLQTNSAKKNTSSEISSKGSADFSKVLARYYRTWLNDSIVSEQYCRERGMVSRAEYYHEQIKKYQRIIEENEEAIDFFSAGDNAFRYDDVLPEKFRGYK